MKKVSQTFLFCILLLSFVYGQEFKDLPEDPQKIVKLKFRLELSNPKDKIIYPYFSPDGEKILLVNKKSTQVWSVKTGKLLFTFPEKIKLNDSFRLKWQPNGSKVLVFDALNSPLFFSKKTPAFLWDTETGKLVAVLKGKKKAIEYVGWSKDGKRFFTIGEIFSDQIELSVWSESSNYDSIMITILENRILLKKGKNCCLIKVIDLKKNQSSFGIFEKPEVTKLFHKHKKNMTVMISCNHCND